MQHTFSIPHVQEHLNNDKHCGGIRPHIIFYYQNLYSLLEQTNGQNHNPKGGDHMEELNPSREEALAELAKVILPLMKDLNKILIPNNN